MDLAAVRSALVAAAGEATSTPALTVTGYVPDSVTEPHLFAAETDISYDATFGRGSDEYLVTLRLLVGRQDDRSSQALLDAYLKGSGAGSIKAKIEADHTLGGECMDLRVERVQSYRWYEHNGVPYVGAEIMVKVIGDGD